MTPDLAIFGKAIAGGFALSVIAGKEALVREVDRGRVLHAGTFNGNPIALSASLATISTLAENDGEPLARARRFGEEIMASMTSLALDQSLPLRVSGHGTVFRPIIGFEGELHDYRDYARVDKQSNRSLLLELFDRGVYCVPDGRWYVSVVHGKEERDHLQYKLPEIIEAVARSYHRN